MEIVMEMKQLKLLIALVRDAPFMWEKSLRGKVDESVMENCWENIGSPLIPTLTGPQVRDIFQGLEHSFAEYCRRQFLPDHLEDNEDKISTFDLEVYNDLYFLKDQISSQDNANGNRSKEPAARCLDPVVHANVKGGRSRREMLGGLDHKFPNHVQSKVSRESGNSMHYATLPELYSAPSTSKTLDSSLINPKNFVDLTNSSSSDSESDDSMADFPILEMVNGGFEIKKKNPPKRAET